MPNNTDAAATTSNTLFASNADSRETKLNLPPSPTLGALQANRRRDEPTTNTKNPRIKTPRSGSVAKACTEVNTPDRTKNVPKSDKENVIIAKSTVQTLKLPRFSVTKSECIRAVPQSQGINEAFSTGSQNHQPPQPNS